MHVLLYLADLAELRQWIGCADERRFAAWMEAVRADDESDWDEPDLKLAHDLLRRVVFEGKLYAGLDEDERYFLTQMLIDLFDEFVESEAVSTELPHAPLLKALEGIPDHDARKMAAYIVRGRELDGDRVLWRTGSPEEAAPLLGWIASADAGRIADMIEAAEPPARQRGTGLLRQVAHAARQAAAGELDLISFVS